MTISRSFMVRVLIIAGVMLALLLFSANQVLMPAEALTDIDEVSDLQVRFN